MISLVLLIRNHLLCTLHSDVYYSLNMTSWPSSSSASIIVITRETSCPGDSGGGLMVRDETGIWTLIGIVSTGHQHLMVILWSFYGNLLVIVTVSMMIMMMTMVASLDAHHHLILWWFVGDFMMIMTVSMMLMTMDAYNWHQWISGWGETNIRRMEMKIQVQKSDLQLFDFSPLCFLKCFPKELA